MKKRNLPKNEKSEPIRREKDKMVWRYCLVILLFCGILVVGFFFAARQHFSAISLGMKNSELRQQRDELQTEQRRLRVSREIAFSPNELEKVARSIGLEKKSENQYEIARAEPKTDDKANELKTEEKSKSTFGKSSKEKTVTVSKTEKSEKTEKTLSDVVKVAEQKTAKDKIADKQVTKLNKKGA